MLVFIAQIILVLSVGGMVFIAIRKIPALVFLTEAKRGKPSRFAQKKFLKIKNFNPFIKQTFSKLRALKKKRLRKTEKERDKKGKEAELDADYWERVKTE